MIGGKDRLYQVVIDRMPEVYRNYSKLKQKWHQLAKGFGLKQEDSWFLGKTPKEAAHILKKYNVISFDVFDTLIFRPYLEPTELFRIVGEQINVSEFQKIRCEMEQKARQEQRKKKKTAEVTLDEIYTMINRETGIKEEVKEIEFSMEYQVCFANPYLKQVTEELQKEKKHLIIISDMYFSQIQIRKILENAGYQKFAAYYISSEYQKSKSSGELYQTVREKEGLNCSFAHIGDNRTADIKQAKKYGIDAFYYRK